jgi:hypothetical protein
MRLTITIITSLLLILGLSLNLGGCQSRYRYPCQDPENWGKPECHNDACKADGSCTDQTLGPVLTPKVFESQRLEDEPPQEESKPEEPAQETKPEPQPQISSNTCQPVSQPEKKINFRGKTMPPPPLAPAEPVVEGEQPVTMDTIVNTSEHNVAAR